MKWVKASERLPETRVVVRWITNNGGPYIEIGDREWILSYNKVHGPYQPDSLDSIEWLDETTPFEQLFTREDMQAAFERGYCSHSEINHSIREGFTDKMNEAFDKWFDTNYPKQ